MPPPVNHLSRRHLIVSLPLAALARPAAAAVGIGVSVQASGDSTLTRAGKVAPLEPGVPLFERDVVRTAADGFAALRLNTDTDISLGPDSLVEIDRYLADMGGQITIGGAMVFDRPDDLPPIDLTLRAAFAQIGVRGTRFFAGPSNGVFAVFVDRGAVTVTAAGQSVTLAEGDGVEVPAPDAPPGDVRKWGADRIAAAFASVGL